LGVVSSFRRIGGEFTQANPDDVEEVPVSLEWDSYRQRTELDGVEYEMLFQWNDRTNSWYFSLFFTDGSALLEGKVVALNSDLLLAMVDPRRPPGALVLIAVEETFQEPTRDQLGMDYVVTYQRYTSDA
jgi:hypothetical protein